MPSHSSTAHHLSTHQLATLRAALSKKHDELTTTLGDLRESFQGGEPGDAVDVATAQIGFDERTSLSGQERALLAEINHALAKLDAGTYGTSETSGHPIPYERLDAVPWARTNTNETPRE